jgi:glutathione synthase/RimK-type ligase-like ATP-grasp enzyme
MSSSTNTIYGLAALTRPIFQSKNYNQTVDALYERVELDPKDAAALLDLGMLHQLLGMQEQGLAIQQDALKLQQHFVVKNEKDAQLFPSPLAVEGVAKRRERGEKIIKLLVLMQPGTFQENTPVEFLVENTLIQLEILYILPDSPLPEIIPEHDVMLIGIGYTEASHALLERMIPWVAAWQKPVINRPEHILKTSREALKTALDNADGVFVAGIQRLNRAETADYNAHFPILIRPLDSHAGRDLKKIDDVASLLSYLENVQDKSFFITEFVDYRKPDGMFTKYRIVLIGGKPYIAHMAMNDHWMIHYLNAGMKEDAAKRELEAEGMASFHTDFALRHAGAFEHMHQRLGLDYLIMDCGETPNGELFVFEADTIMIVHDMDDENIYPYKKPVMKVLFDAFAEFVRMKV